MYFSTPEIDTFRATEMGPERTYFRETWNRWPTPDQSQATLDHPFQPLIHTLSGLVLAGPYCVYLRVTDFHAEILYFSYHFSLVTRPSHDNWKWKFPGLYQSLVRGSGEICGRFLVEPICGAEALIGLDPARDLELFRVVS